MFIYRNVYTYYINIKKKIHVKKIKIKSQINEFPFYVLKSGFPSLISEMFEVTILKIIQLIIRTMYSKLEVKKIYFPSELYTAVITLVIHSIYIYVRTIYYVYPPFRSISGVIIIALKIGI